MKEYFKNEVRKNYSEDLIEKRKEYFKYFLEFVDILRLRVNQKYDNVIAVTGSEGVGKSTFAYWVAKLIEGNYFDFRKNYVYDKDLGILIQKLQDKKIKVIVDDEAIRRFYKLEWYKPYQVRLNQLYAIARKYRTTTILCLPRFYDFNEFFRNHRINFWVHLLSRGVAVLFCPDWSPFTKDPWWLDSNQKKIEKITLMKKLVNIDLNFKLKVLKICRNFVSPLCFPPMPEEDENKYNEFISLIEVKNLVEEEKQDSVENSLAKKYRESIIKAIKYLKMQEGYNFNKIANILNISRSTASSLLSTDKDYQEYLESERKKKLQEKILLSKSKKLPFV